MAVKIRLKRMGRKDRPFYRLVVVDSRWRRDGKTIEDIGWYDPVKKPATVSIKEARVYYWMDNGAQASETARSLLKQNGIWQKYRNGEYKDVLAQADSKDQPVVTSAIPEPEPAPSPASEHGAPSVADTAEAETPAAAEPAQPAEEENASPSVEQPTAEPAPATEETKQE